MNKKTQSRLRRGLKTRKKISSLGKYRLSVHKTANHTYAQIISPQGDATLASVATTQKSLKESLQHGGNKQAAQMVGQLIARKACDLGIHEVAFDRSGFKYHGRIKEIADAARNNGLQF